MQGALLAHFLEGPVLLTSVVVGRKYVERRCALALGVSSCMHTKVYGTSVKLEHRKGDAGERGHDGTFGDRGTQGDGDECLSWSDGDQLVGRHDGRTGCALSPAGGCSNVSRAELFKLFTQTCAKCATQCGSWLRLDLSDDELDSVTHPRSAPSVGCAPNAAEEDLRTSSGSTSEHSAGTLNIDRYCALKRAAGWYNIARCSWMSETGLATLGDP